MNKENKKGNPKKNGLPFLFTSYANTLINYFIATTILSIISYNFYH